jgi:hypothetical protein
MVKYILALSLVAATPTAIAASDAEKKQEEQQSRELQRGTVPTYWPTYWPTYFPTEFPTSGQDGEETNDYIEVVEETRSYSLPPPIEHEWVAPPTPAWTDGGWSESSPQSSSLDSAPVWDDDGWSGRESSPQPSSWDSAPVWDDDGWSGSSGGKAGKTSSKGRKCSTKGGKVSLIQMHTTCEMNSERCVLTISSVKYFIIFGSLGWMGENFEVSDSRLGDCRLGGA